MKFKKILEREKFDVIGIQIFTFHLNAAKGYVRLIKEASPETKIVLGGPHPSCDPENIFSYFPEIDWAFRGEAEIGLARLLDLMSEEKEISRPALLTVPGLIWRDENQKTIVNSPLFSHYYHPWLSVFLHLLRRPACFGTKNQKTERGFGH